MARFILDMQEEWGITVLLVEHDMGMVMDISSHVVVLNFGQVIAQRHPGRGAARSGGDRAPTWAKRRRGAGRHDGRYRLAPAGGVQHRRRARRRAARADRARLCARLQGHAGRQLRDRRIHDVRRVSLLDRATSTSPCRGWIALALSLAGIATPRRGGRALRPAAARRAAGDQHRHGDDRPRGDPARRCRGRLGRRTCALPAVSRRARR